MESDGGKHEEDGDSAALCSIFLKCFACCPKLHHLNHIFAVLPVPPVSRSLHASPPPPLFSCPVLAARRRDIPAICRATSMTHLCWIRFGNAAAGWIEGKGCSLMLASPKRGITSAVVSVCLSESAFSLAHALFNPYPDSLGPKTDLFFHRDSKHTSLLSDAQTND